MVDERVLARELDRALAGEATGDEARELAALLVAAAEPARFDVADEELERALDSVRPQRVHRARRRLVPAVALAAVVAAAALAAWLARTPGSEVQARAARAVDATFFVLEEVRSSRFPATNVSGYVDGRTGRAHVRVSPRRGGAIVADTVVRANGSVARWLAASNTTTYAPSCDALPGGCAEALDPLALYVRTLEQAHVRTRRTAYELTIRSGKVEQIVTVDRQTYLPRLIEWRQDGRRVSVTRFTALERQRAPLSPDAWTLESHPNARVVELTKTGERVRILSRRATSIPHGARWLGPRHNGYRARVEAIELTGGSALRIAYGPLVVWDYTDVIPPAVLRPQGPAQKVFEIPGGIVHASFALDGGVVADATFADGNTAVLSGDKLDVVRAVQQLVRAQ